MPVPWLSCSDSAAVALVSRCGELTRRQLAEHAENLAGQISGCSRLLVWPSNAAGVVAALAACQATGAELFLAHQTLAWEQITEIAGRHQIGAIVSDRGLTRRPAMACDPEPGIVHLMTSGTTGMPKIARHLLAALSGTIRATASSRTARWLLAYPPTSFAGLQVILSAIEGGGTLVEPDGTAPADFCRALREQQITHMSGTPSLWRKVLLAMAPSEPVPHLRHITLGGEAADQATLDRLAAQFPQARIRHIYASTEAGVLFTVSDHRAGFPRQFLEEGFDGVQFRLRDGILEVSSPRLMQRYVSSHDSPLSAGGWLSTGDVIEVCGDRCHFRGRTDGRLNVGGYKVFPDQVEAALLAIDGVADARVFGQRGPLAGDVLVAEIVPGAGRDPEALRAAVLNNLRAGQPSFAVPRILRMTDQIAVSAFQKKSRRREVEQPACRD